MSFEHFQEEVAGFQPSYSGYSPAFYPLVRDPAISNTEIFQLRDFTMRTKESSRICLHQNEDDALQLMVIAQYRKFDPDRPTMRVHRGKDKIFQPLYGRLFMVWASALGQIEREKVLSQAKGDFQLISSGQIYNDFPVDEVTIHVEFVKGPYNSRDDREFPVMPWDKSMSEKKSFYDYCMKRAEGM